jgi:hypothetical protein
VTFDHVHLEPDAHRDLDPRTGDLPVSLRGVAIAEVQP